MGFTMSARYGGVCGKCNARFEEGDSILWEKETKKVSGCPRCYSAPRNVTAQFRAPLQSFQVPDLTLLPRQILPPSRTEVEAVPAPTIQLDEHQQMACNWREGKALVAACAGCHRRGQGILMHDGSIKAVESVKVGDLLMGSDGTPRRVLRLIRGRGEMVEVVPVKGASFVVNLDHVLSVEMSTSRKHRDHKKVFDLTVRDYLMQPIGWRTRAKLFRRGVDFATRTRHDRSRLRDVDPYFLGMLLGDGSFVGKTVGLHKPGAFVVQLAKEQAKIWGLRLKVVAADSPCPGYRFVLPERKGVPRAEYVNPLRQALNRLGLGGLDCFKKFIPDAYKCGTVGVRRAMLAGLFDADGHLCTGSLDYISASRQLSEDIAFVARSLGLAAYVALCEKRDQFGGGGTYWRVSVSGDLTALPFRRLKATPRKQIKDVRCTGFTVNRIGTVEDFYGFTLDGDGRYLLSDFTVTHNSGKTTLLVERIAALLREGTPPESLLTVVYNRAAAELLKQRLDKRVGLSYVQRLGVFTFHGWAYSLLREAGSGLVGKGRVIGVNDGPSAASIAAAAVKQGKLDFHGDVIDLLKLVDFAREGMVDLNAPDAATKLGLLKPGTAGSFIRTAIEFFREHQQLKLQRGLIDFGDMLYQVVQVAAVSEPFRNVLATRYRHVQVDECQDITPTRLHLASLVGEGAKSWLMVGDLRQAVYSFQGANPDLVMEWARDPEVKLLSLPVNRRSTGAIVDAGNRLTRGHGWNVGGDSLPATTTEGEKVTHWATRSSVEEADAVAMDVMARKEELPLSSNRRANYVCLIRTNAQAVSLEFAFQRLKIPVRVLGHSGGVWGSGLGRDLLAYIRAGEGQLTQDLTRVANKPRRMLKRDTVSAALETSGGDLQKFIDTIGLTRNGHRLAVDLVQLANADWNARVEKAEELLLSALRQSEEDFEEVDDDKKATYKALARQAKTYGSLAAIDAAIEEANKVKEGDPAVEVSSIHRSKGAEWPVVYVCGASSGLMPHARASDLEEELRLFYVAVTRGRDKVVVSAGGPPSTFLNRLFTKEEINGVEVVEATEVEGTGVQTPGDAIIADFEDVEEKAARSKYGTDD